MGFDDQLFTTINEMFAAEGWETFFTFVTRLGNGWVLAAIIVPALLLFDRRRLKEQLLPMAISVAVGGLFVATVKPVVDRPRPPEHFEGTEVVVNTPAGIPSDRSFPSGHTQTAFGTAAYLSCLYPAAAPRLPRPGGPGGPLAGGHRGALPLGRPRGRDLGNGLRPPGLPNQPPAAD